MEGSGRERNLTYHKFGFGFRIRFDVVRTGLRGLSSFFLLYSCSVLFLLRFRNGRTLSAQGLDFGNHSGIRVCVFCGETLEEGAEMMDG